MAEQPQTSTKKPAPRMTLEKEVQNWVPAFGEKFSATGVEAPIVIWMSFYRKYRPTENPSYTGITKVSVTLRLSIYDNVPERLESLIEDMREQKWFPFRPA